MYVLKKNLFSIKRNLLFRKMLLLQSKLVILKYVSVLRLGRFIHPLQFKLGVTELKYPSLSRLYSVLMAQNCFEYYFWSPARARY